MTRLRQIAYAAMCVAELVGGVVGDLLDRIWPPDPPPPPFWTDGT